MKLVFIILLVGIVIQLCYALYFFVRFFYIRPLFDAHHKVDLLKPVSIIICAKNEAENLQQNLPSILAQRYENASGKANFEVIVVDDASTDSTPAILQKLEQQFENLWSVRINADEPRKFPGKKFALSKGVMHASYEWLLLTDADCTPAGTDWLHLMAIQLSDKKIVAGYGQYQERNGLLNKFIRFETLHSFVQYASYAVAGRPYMAVGRNLACTKEIFFKAQSEDVWNKLPSGDDDLLMCTMATALNTAVVVDNNATTISQPKSKFADWVKQKQRHLSTGKYYKPDIKLLLSVYGLSHAMVWLAFAALMCTSLWSAGLCIMLCRCIVYWMLWLMAAKKMKEKKLSLYLPLLDLLWMFYNFLFSPYIIFKNKQRWT